MEPPAAGGLQVALGEYPLSDKLLVPPTYQVDDSGIYRRGSNPITGEVSLTEIASRPIVIAGRCRSIQDQSVQLVMVWRNSNGQCSQHTVPRRQVSDARSAVALSDLDAPIHSNNAAEVIGYIHDFEAANNEILPEARVSAVMGWQGQDSFVWGRNQVRASGIQCSGAIEELPPSQWQSGQIHLLPGEPGVRAVAEGFHTRGTLKEWVEMVRLALPYPKVMLGIFAALVPPLMKFLPELSNFILDFCGSTSQGKTTTLRVAASVWGCPDERNGGILHTWDVTLVFAERIAALCDYLPVFLDDTKRVRRPEELGKHIYNFASGVGRGHGSIHAVQRTTRTHSVLLSTGEAPMTSFTNDGGTRARCLCLWGSPFGGTDARTVEVVRRINGGVLRQYGQLGPLMIQTLLATPGLQSEIQQIFEAQLDHWSQRAGANGVAGRAAHYVAALGVAEHLFHRMTSLPCGESSPLSYAWEAVVKGAVESDRATDALKAVLSWATSQQGRFHGRLEAEGGDATAPPGGWLGAWTRGEDWKYLAVLPTELRGFLERQKFDVEAVLRTWEDREWLWRDGEHRTRKMMVGERRERCLVLKRETCEGVDAD
jgi:hypothetical protein